jgi:hypothetical protein
MKAKPRVSYRGEKKEKIFSKKFGANEKMLTFAPAERNTVRLKD